MPPGIGKALPQTGDGRKAASDEDGPSTAKPVVEGNGQPATDAGTTQVRSGIDEANEPGGLGGTVGNAKLMLVKHLGTVDDGFICGAG